MRLPPPLGQEGQRAYCGSSRGGDSEIRVDLWDNTLPCVTGAFAGGRWFLAVGGSRA